MVVRLTKGAVSDAASFHFIKRNDFETIEATHIFMQSNKLQEAFGNLKPGVLNKAVIPHMKKMARTQ